MSKARVGVWLGVVLGGCLGEASRLTERTEGKLELTAEVQARGPVEVRFIPEEDVKSFLSVRLSQSRSELEQQVAARPRLKTKVEQWRAEEIIAADQLRRNNGEILLRRLDAVRTAASVGEMDAQRRFLTRQSLLAKRTALEVSQRAAAAQKDYEEAEKAAVQLKDGSFVLRSLPKGVSRTSIESGTRKQLALVPGRYAVAAKAIGPDGTARVWLLWTIIEAGGVSTVVLHDKNLVLSQCADCVLSPASPVVNRE
jgi:hypothetical protein